MQSLGACCGQPVSQQHVFCRMDFDDPAGSDGSLPGIRGSGGVCAGAEGDSVGISAGVAGVIFI